MLKNRTSLLSSFVLIFALLSLCGCAKSEKTAPEAPAELSQPLLPPAEQPGIDAKVVLPPPQPAEVQEVVKRLYGDALTVESSSCIVGDFNGDGFQDIAIIARPAAGKLAAINSEVANWILEDPQQIPLLDPTKAVQPFPPAPPPVQVELTDSLLVVVHGYGQDGWRNPQAIQTYLLKNAVGKNLSRQTAQEYLNNTKSAKQRLLLRGDVIRGSLDGKPGFLYYSGAKYIWQAAE